MPAQAKQWANPSWTCGHLNANNSSNPVTTLSANKTTRHLAIAAAPGSGRLDITPHRDRPTARALTGPVSPGTNAGTANAGTATQGIPPAATDASEDQRHSHSASRLRM